MTQRPPGTNLSPPCLTLLLSFPLSLSLSSSCFNHPFDHLSSKEEEERVGNKQEEHLRNTEEIIPNQLLLGVEQGEVHSPLQEEASRRRNNNEAEYEVKEENQSPEDPSSPLLHTLVGWILNKTFFWIKETKV